MPSENKVKVILHGHLKDLYQDEIALSGANVAEIINGMCKTTNAFNPIPGVERHTVSIVGYNTEQSLYEPLNDNVKELHVVPAMCGGKSGGFMRIIIGAVIIAASFLMPASIGALSILGTTVSSMMFNFGLSLILGGLLELLSPAPRKDLGSTGQDPEASKYLGSGGNTVVIGTRIPLIFGRHKAGGQFLSFNISAKDVTAGENNIDPDSVYEVVGTV